MPRTISLCMITKNEERYLGQCLNSVKEIIDEIIIADTGSTDKTKEIAKNFNAKIFDFKWSDDFSAARNESLRHATKDWILVLDADEVIEKNDLDKIKKLAENPEDFAGFQLEQRSYINNFFEGAVKNDSEFELVKEYPFYISHFLVRLFKSSLGIRFRHRVHEIVEDYMKEKSLRYKKTGVAIHHFGSVKNPELVNEKAEQYSNIILKQLEEEPDNPRYNYQAGRMYVGGDDFDKALKYFKKTAKMNPNYKLIFSEIAKVYLQIDNKNKAVEYFKKSIKHNPYNPSPANNLAVVYMSMGKFVQAKKILEGQLERHPNNEALKHNFEECMKNLTNYRGGL
ncbi:glycosyltransferase [Candidatus Woesearchaeota archaeon]|nr:glycosyltransferase [Candidatus Woesearchaeota archaeon]